MRANDWFLKAVLTAIALLLGLLAIRPLVTPPSTASAQAARFDHVFIVSTMYLYKGVQGLLVMDRRNGNVWFIPKVNETFRDPVFIVRMQFEKLDQPPN